MTGGLIVVHAVRIQRLRTIESEIFMAGLNVANDGVLRGDASGRATLRNTAILVATVQVFSGGYFLLHDQRDRLAARRCSDKVLATHQVDHAELTARSECLLDP